MGRSKRKRKTSPTNEPDDSPEVKVSRVPEGGDFLTDLHADGAEVLSDLLLDRSLIFVEGPVGCGKTSLIKRVAQSFNLPVKTIHLSDQIDSKSFIGAYQCTEVPGEFVWEASVFAESVQTRCLIILEDLDAATPDLVSSLLLMAKSWSSVLRPDGIVREFHPSVRIVATIRTENSHSESSELIGTNPLRVQLSQFETEDLKKIVEHKYPNLAEVSEKLLEIYVDICSSSKESSSIDRELSSSDLIRACHRLAKLPSLKDNHNVLLELADVYALSVVNPIRRKSILALLGHHLSVATETAEALVTKRCPEVKPNVDDVVIGRAKLPIRKGETAGGKWSAKLFGLTVDARLLMERCAASISMGNEAVLLTGETGVGKTSIIQLIASYANVQLDVVNLSQDSDSTDLIGGFKPIGTIELLQPFINEFDEILRKTFKPEGNERFFSHFKTLLDSDDFLKYLELCNETAKIAITNNANTPLALSWANLRVRCQRLSKSLGSRKSAFPFSYVEGVVARAARQGHWLLVDEINLASSECLDAIIHVLDGVIPCHPGFRLFACMNPATDTGKKKLPVGIRSRFTEFFVHEPRDRDQLIVIIRNYVPTIAASHLAKVLDFYEMAVSTFPRKYSLRNLCRALSFAADNLYGSLYRSIFEGISMAFGSDLDNDGTIKFERILKSLFNDVPSGTTRPTKPDQILVEGSYIDRGDKQPHTDQHYVHTVSVKKNLSRLSRAVASGRFPVLLEGETSAGKTSMIVNLAKLTGNIVHRINNHEHTDIQEYIGCYAPGEDGKLAFSEGVLLQAVRHGHWVILDELNLAPVEVLEALNRLLDDNRELFVAERNETIEAHPRFRLFATQNPVGTYAGRKRLSRAFLNRFIVLRFDHPPFDELTQIVCARCAVAPTPAAAMVKVLMELKRCRSNTGLFSSSNGLMTLRDLFRWANRLALSTSGEWRQVLADQGYFLLAARCRNNRDAEEVVNALQKVLKVKISPENLFSLQSPYLPADAMEELCQGGDHIVANYAMRRMLVLTAEAWRCSEPVLMVGETGCGKTTAATLIAKGSLLTINCHERTETSDLLGTIRPSADGTFFWQDGVVVQAMKNGSKLLIDEISLAADSVLERLNSLFESTRTVLLTDAGAGATEVVAAPDFQVVATMNPGTDHGKKELSKALRNRFTEIWCSCDHSVSDMNAILIARLVGISDEVSDTFPYAAAAIVDFFTEFNTKFGSLFRTVFSIRDLIAAADLYYACRSRAHQKVFHSIVDAISTVVLDSLGILPTRTTINIQDVKTECMQMLRDIVKRNEIAFENPTILAPAPNYILFNNYPVRPGPLQRKKPKDYNFSTPTTKENVSRVARALLINKPIMLEGSPGAGKSSLIVALAAAAGYPLIRLNLSDQTDLSDLFGHDVPITNEDGHVSFQWQDGPVLKAIKEGSWILLDEMNLASQSVLEGLNACFDFRQTLFIAELNKSFAIDSNTCRFFACQNPQQQGGNRRALPKSFLNRFTSIYIEPFNAQDFSAILKASGHGDSLPVVPMVTFNRQMEKLIEKQKKLNSSLLDFEFNLRDLLRWASFIKKFEDIALGAEIVYISRLPTKKLQATARKRLSHDFKFPVSIPKVKIFQDEEKGVCFGSDKYCINQEGNSPITSDPFVLLPTQTRFLQHICICVQLNWNVLLSGPRLSGKSSMVEVLAHLGGRNLKRMRLNKETDASELLGTYEQVLNYEMLRQCASEFAQILSSETCGLPEADVASLLTELETSEGENVQFLRLKISQAAALATGETQQTLEAIAQKLETISLKFEWQPSVFVDAFLNGHWLIIEDVNCCSAAVLDRLNCCLESGGKLVLPEQADNTDIEKAAHKDFRIFFTMDPKNGQLSRAMKNRCVELCVGDWNAWHSEGESSLNVLLRNERLMCAMVEEDDVFAEHFNNIDNVKNALRAAARKRITIEQRLALIAPKMRLKSAKTEALYSDLIGLEPVSVPRVYLPIFSPNRLLRFPRAALLRFSLPAIGPHAPTVYYSEFQWLQLDRWSQVVETNTGISPAQQQWAYFALALMATSTDAIVNPTFITHVFKDVPNDLKIEMRENLVKSLRGDGIRSSPAPWDLRFYKTENECASYETRDDARLFQLLQVWTAAEYDFVHDAATPDSPFGICKAFNNGTLDSSQLPSRAYALLDDVFELLVTTFGRLRFAGYENFVNGSFHFLFNLIVGCTAASCPSGDVHPLLILRQIFQDLGVNTAAEKNHPCHLIWVKIATALQAESKAQQRLQLETFVGKLEVSTVGATEKYINTLRHKCTVQPFSDADELAAATNGITAMKQDYVNALNPENVTAKPSLDCLVRGISEYLKMFATVKECDFGSRYLAEFPYAPTQTMDVLNRIEFENGIDRTTVQFLTALNSNIALANIAPQLKTIHLTMVEVMLDALSAFWRSFRFSMTSLSAVPLKGLASAHDQIMQYYSLIWTMRNVSSVFTKALRTQMSMRTQNIFAIPEPIDKNWETLFSRATKTFETLIPPLGLIDPGLNHMIMLEILHIRGAIFELFSSCTSAFPAATSAHPFLRFVHENVLSTLTELQTIESQNKRVYRVNQFRFDELAVDLRSFFVRWSSMLTDYTVQKDSWNIKTDFNVVLKHSTTTKNLINMASNLSERLLFNYTDMPDIIVPIYTSLQCILIILNIQDYLDDRFIRLHQLKRSTERPIEEVVSGIQSALEFNIDSGDFLDFVLIGRDGPMPMQFQQQLVCQILAKNGVQSEGPETAITAFHWFVDEWRNWFERHREKRNQMFLYREKAAATLENEDDDETMPDPEDLEIKALFPDFSDGEVDFEAAKATTATTSVTSRLPEAEDICKMMKLVYDGKCDANVDQSDAFLPVMWIVDEFNHSDAVTNLTMERKQPVNTTTLIDYHLLFLSQFRESLGTKAVKKRAVNVYNDNDKAEIMRCADAVQKLQERVNQIREEFPEESNLKDIADTLTSFMEIDCGVPQMRLAHYVEKILEKAELWQSIAPRMYSLTEYLEELQQILVDWRKMQVRSWEHIIDAVTNDSHAIAVALGFPFIETLLLWTNKTPDNEEADVLKANFLASVVDWVYSSSLVDFEARLETARFVSRLSAIFFVDDPYFETVSASVQSIVFYFEAYAQIVRDRLGAKRAAVVQELENFVNIVKFHDLNLWSVKNSAEKAHQKLFRIVKKYKLEGNDPLSTTFADFLPPAVTPSAITIARPLSCNSDNTQLNFGNFFERFSKVLKSLPGINEPDALFDLCTDYMTVLEKDIIYNGDDDEANEKLQGQALFDRQKKFSALVKHVGAFGLRSRRGVHVSSEDVLHSTLSMNIKESDLDEPGFRAAAVVRNVVMRLVNQLNANKQPHILKQVSIQMIGHIRGLTEYGFSWLSNVLDVFRALRKMSSFLVASRERLRVCQQNGLENPRVFAVDNKINSYHSSVLNYAKQLKENASMLVKLVEAVPDTAPSTPHVDPSMDLLTPMRDRAFFKDDSEYPKFQKDTAEILKVLTNFINQVSNLKSSDADDALWKVSDVSTLFSMTKATVKTCYNLLRDSGVMNMNFYGISRRMYGDLEKLTNLTTSKKLKALLKEPCYGETSTILSDVFLCKMQSMLKSIASKIPAEDAPNTVPLDVFQKIVLGLQKNDFTKELGVVECLIDKLLHCFDAKQSDLDRYLRLMNEMLDTFDTARSVLGQIANWIAALYVKMGHVWTRILKNGLVNPIPKKEEGESGKGRDMDNVGGENCGMGEGEGLKDVGEEMEETGQVDDLRDDNEDEGPQDDDTPKEKPKDSETPLEMEDDFAADLENLDGQDEDKNDEKDNDGDDDEGPQPDWDMGDVDEPEENQLDPNLWDKPPADDKDMDDNADGADEQTDDLAAKENDDTVAKEKDDPAVDGSDDENPDEEKPEDGEEEEKKDEEFDLENSNRLDANEEDDDDEEPAQQEPQIEEGGDEENDAQDVEDTPDDANDVVDDNNDDVDMEEPEHEAPPQGEEREADDGAQNDEMEAPSRGANAQDEPQNTDEANANDDQDDAEEQKDEAQKSTAKQRDSSKGSADTDNAAQSASDKSKAEPKKEEVAQNEPDSEASERRPHVQPREDEDEAMDIDRPDEDVEEAIEGDELDEQSNSLAHIADDLRDSRDRHVVQTSTIEEARSTRSQYERMNINRNETQNERLDGDQNMDEPTEPDADDDESFVLSPEQASQTLIHFGTDMFDLSERAVSNLPETPLVVDQGQSMRLFKNQLKPIVDSVALMASELAENLRQILEPTIANRLQGDYRTGKRLNMRRLVSYIASDYRKNRIWLRRTKKQQRNFQIMIAVDDSQSMGDNRMCEITSQSLCLIEKAFRQLEVGQLAICKFGQDVEMLHKFTAATDAHDSLVQSLIGNLTFNQTQTDLIRLLSFANNSFQTARETAPASSLPVQLLIIIGDGHGVFSQGRESVKTAIRNLEAERVTVLYVIVDGKNSILSMNYTTFENGRPVMTPYIGVFPFPFYALVRSVATLPGTLAEAIRQWFEMAVQD